jgi:GNAT superfamily N-acetyltransferase
MRDYARAHRDLKVYNEPQYLAREAAVALGEGRFDESAQFLSRLQDIAKQSPEKWAEAASAYDPNYQPKLPATTGMRRISLRQEPTRLKLTGGRDPAVDAFLKYVDENYPANPLVGGERVLAYSEEPGKEHFSSVKLKPSVVHHGYVDVEWMMAHPQRQGVGSKVLKELQRLATEHRIKGLTLYPWEKGRVSKRDLVRFYKRAGFVPIRGERGSMKWDVPGG